MALITCQECRKQLSDTANACPHCGAPAAVAKKSGGFSIVKWTIVLVFGAFVFKCVSTAGQVADASKLEEPRKIVAATVAPTVMPPPSPDVEKELQRMRAMKPADFCTKELGKLKGKKGAMPQPWYDALIRHAPAQGVSASHMSAIQLGSAEIGMNACGALASWGKPQEVSRSTYSFGTKEQWVYGGRNYLYFTNDKLDAIQN